MAEYVNQQPLEEAAEQMAFVSVDNPDYHGQFLDAIDKGITACQSETEAASVITVVNQSGYHVLSSKDALEILVEVRRLYLDAFHRAAR